MNKVQGCFFSAVIVMMSGTAPQAMAARGDIQASEISQAFVSTVNITTVNGHLSIANKRNCMVTDSQDNPTLSTCPDISPITPSIKSYTTIELRAGQCLADDGQGAVLKACDIADADQQWKTSATSPTEVKNIKTNRCLTSVGINKPVKLEKCSGSYTQAWSLPQ